MFYSEIDFFARKLQKIATVIAVLYLFFVGADSYLCIGVGIFIFFCFQFIINLGLKIEVRDVIILVACFQWIIGAALSYIYVPSWFLYSMKVPESEYMSFVVPGVICFVCGLCLPFYSTKIDHVNIRVWIRQQLAAHPNLDIIILGIGFFASFASPFSPSSLRFVFYLLSMLMYIGTFYLLFSQRKHKNLIIITVFLILFVESLRAGMFHELLLWGIFMFLVFAFVYQLGYKKKLFILFILLLGVFFLQLVKRELRTIVWSKGNISSSDAVYAFGDVLIKKSTENDKLLAELEFFLLISRINQGWIISQIMQYVPEKEPFANGETIIRSIEDSIIPRFLKANKMIVGGTEYYSRFTGLTLRSGTSMDLGIIGEAYANYGVRGGIAFMFILGLFYNFVLYIVYRISQKNPMMFLWVPLLFLYVIKAESGFYMAINHLIKASIFLIIFFYILKFFYKFDYHPFDEWQDEEEDDDNQRLRVR